MSETMKRYAHWVGGMLECRDGKYVRHEDVAALERANEALAAPVTLDEWLHVAGANAVLNKRRAALAGQDAASEKGIARPQKKERFSNEEWNALERTMNDGERR